eukprot:2422165-Pyramimonas_sp.AAC.1
MMLNCGCLATHVGMHMSPVGCQTASDRTTGAWSDGLLRSAITQLVPVRGQRSRMSCDASAV